MIFPRPPSELLAQQGLELRPLDPCCRLFNHPPCALTFLPSSLWSALLEHGLQLALPPCLPQDFDLLLIFLADENDNQPLFTESTYQAEVMENSPAGRCWARLGTPAAARHHLGPRCLRTPLCLIRAPLRPGWGGSLTTWLNTDPTQTQRVQKGRGEEGAQL